MLRHWIAMLYYVHTANRLCDPAAGITLCSTMHRALESDPHTKRVLLQQSDPHPAAGLLGDGCVVRAVRGASGAARSGGGGSRVWAGGRARTPQLPTHQHQVRLRLFLCLFCRFSCPYCDSAKSTQGTKRD